jgi:hypothetical protein
MQSKPITDKNGGFFDSIGHSRRYQSRRCSPTFPMFPESERELRNEPRLRATLHDGAGAYVRARVVQRAFAEPNAGSAGLPAAPLEIIRPRAVGCFVAPPADWAWTRGECA